MNRYLAKALRIGTTVVEVGATVSGLFVSIVQTRGASLWRFFVGGIVSGLGGAGTGITTYSFQGKAIAANAGQDYITTVPWKYRRIQCGTQRLQQKLNENARLLQNMAAGDNEGAVVQIEPERHRPAELLDNEEPCCSSLVKSLIAQVSYLIDDNTIEIFNRYLFLMLISSEIVSIPDGLFIFIFVFSNIISMLFRATNAGYCGTSEIANYFREGSDSCYAGILKNLARHPAAVKTLGVVGSTEHCITHLTGVLLIVKPPYLFITSALPAAKYFLLPFGALTGVLLLPLTFAQTWFFDFGETQKIMKRLRRLDPVDEDVAEEPLDIPVWLAKILYGTMPVMPVVHGAEIAVSILALSQIIDPYTPIVFATGAGIVSVAGNWCSEKREADNQLAPLVYNERMKRMDAEEAARTPQPGIN